MKRLLLFTSLAAAILTTVGASLAIASAPVTPTTNAATNVQQTSATLSGHVFPDKSVSTYYYFQYGTTTAYGSTTPLDELYVVDRWNERSRTTAFFGMNRWS